MEFKDAIANMDNDINTATNAAHNALNIAADNRTNITAHYAEGREVHERNAQLQNARIDQAKREFTKKLEERDKALIQQFSEVYEYIERCKTDNSFLDEVVDKLPKPKKEKKCTDI
jgi:vacuolar-type H+-ATPase subunit E/Vma4